MLLPGLIGLRARAEGRPDAAAAPALAEMAGVTTAAVAEELGAVARELADARSHFDDKVALRSESALEMLERAQISFFEEDYPLAVTRLMDLTARPDFQKTPAFPEALTWLGEALVQLGFPKAGATEMRRALAQPALPTALRHTLIRYLTLSAAEEPLENLRDAWQRYQQSRPEGELAPEDREVRYLYAKALYRGGALSEAGELFGAIAQGDPYALQALYFLGVIGIARDELKPAREKFDAARIAWENADARVRPPRDVEPDWWDVDPEGPAGLVAEEVEPMDPERALDEGRARHDRLGQAIHLALARLDASRDNLDAAVFHYRQVPPGSPDHAAAIQELIWAHFRRGEFARGARLVDQLLAGRGDDRTAAELSIWKAHLLALSADYAASLENYAALEASLDRRRRELESNLSGDPRMFPDAVLAWTAPATASRARELEATVVEQEEALAEAGELVVVLQTTLGGEGNLPGVRAGKAVHQRLTARLTTLVEGLGKLQAPPAEMDALRASASRLTERLARFAVALDEAEIRWRARIGQVLSEERPLLAAYGAGLVDETSQTRRLGMAMAVGARARLEDYAADAHFRQIDLAWWRVDELRRKVKDARKSQRELTGPMEGEVLDFRRERQNDPIPGVTEADLVPE